MVVNIRKESKRNPEEVIRKAIEVFGPRGAGLRVKRLGDHVARFDGQEGFVFVQALKRDAGSKVDVEGREWTDWVQKFVQKL